MSFNKLPCIILLCLSACGGVIQHDTKLIPLTSAAGAAILNDSHPSNYFWKLNEQFVTQQTPTYCSVASSVMVLNALSVAPPDATEYPSDRLLTQGNFFNEAVEQALPKDTLQARGATLEALGRALATFPVQVHVVHANHAMTAAQFRAMASKIVQSGEGYILVNYLRAALGQAGSGHISPLGAYEAGSDRFLILDVTSTRYPPMWVTTESLWQAMSTVDTDATDYRGFVVISSLGRP